MHLGHCVILLSCVSKIQDICHMLLSQLLFLNILFHLIKCFFHSQEGLLLYHLKILYGATYLFLLALGETGNLSRVH